MKKYLFLAQIIVSLLFNVNASSEDAEPQKLAESAPEDEIVKLAGSAEDGAVQLAGSVSEEAMQLAGSAAHEKQLAASAASNEDLQNSLQKQLAHLMGSDEVRSEQANFVSSVEATKLAASGSQSGSGSSERQETSLSGSVSSDAYEAKSNEASVENEKNVNSAEHTEVNVLVGSEPSDKLIQNQIGVDYYKIDSNESAMEKLQGKEKELDSETKQLISEIEAGDMTQLLGTNHHHLQPDFYPDFGRRFVLQYPYKDTVNEVPGDEDEAHLTPKLASPELVLAVAQESEMLEAATPVNPSDEIIQKDILRTGNYWNAYWKEDVDPNHMLRTRETKKLESVKANVIPGTDIYELVIKLKQVSPKLLYVINKSKKQ